MNLCAYACLRYTVEVQTSVTIPKPIHIVIDDVGWWSGRDGSAQQEPYRTGMQRDHCLADYEAIVYLGESLGMRPQAAMVLCEWDRENILRDLPDSTWMGSAWDNSRHDTDKMDAVAAYLAQHSDAIELTLHGVGHEHWRDAAFSRAEWFDEHGHLQPCVEQHLSYFARLMQMNKLGAFPRSFVPCAFKYRFAAAEKGMASLLAARGVRMLSTPFSTMFSNRAPESGCFGFEEGLMVLDRGQDIAPWNAVGYRPQETDCIRHPIVGMHWPNILHADPDRNREVVDAWVDLCKRHAATAEWVLASDTDSFCTQLGFAESKIHRLADAAVEIDATAMRTYAWPHFQRTVQVKLSATAPLALTAEGAELCAVSTEATDAGFMSTLTLHLNDDFDKLRLTWERAPR